MNINLITGLILLYLGLGLMYSEIRRIIVRKTDSFEETLAILDNNFYSTLNKIFYPIVVGRLAFDTWRMKRYF